MGHQPAIAFVHELRFGGGRRLPSVLQTEAAECGLACLAMIARYHGHAVDLPSLRQRFSTSLKGVNLARVMAMAGELGFDTRPLRLELDELPQLRAPCILHWDLNHFVVLKRATAKEAWIHDPARGVRRLPASEVSKHFTGVALELAPRPDFRPIEARQTISLRALTGRVLGLKRALAVILGLALALEAFALVGPFYLQWILDQVLVSADHDLLNLLGIGFASIVEFQALFTAARAWSVTWLGSVINVQWSANLFGHLMRLPLEWFEKRHVGDVVSRFGSIQSIQQTLTTSFVASMLDGMMAAVTAVVMLLYSIDLSLLVFSGFVAYAALRWGIFGPLRRAQEEQIVYAARQQSELLESIRGAQAIKLANKQPERLARYANATVDTANRSIAIQRIGIGFGAVNQLLFGLLRIALLWWGARLVLDGAFSAGMLVAFAAYADQFTARGASLIDKLIEFRMLRLHAERLADIALSAPESALDAHYQGPEPEPSIELRNVSFRYAEGEPWILRHCSLRIDAGESVAIVGPSGCGKTTLVKLILGLLTPTEGEVLFGGIDIRRFGLARYRSLVGAVMQDDQLFAGSIADNIAFFDPDANPARIEAAARLAALHDDIAAMPMGYQALVGDMGSSLSGGQKQRLILARALYRKPRLLVLDEATSHLDNERERHINEAIQRLRITRVVIAHRQATITSAQRALLVANGAVQPIRLHLHEVEAAG
ncbi:ABC-type bacteriocin/lantibiotic exporter withN-terminal double-glycine peptidase domain [Mizugakiibacter sediminis]|uniref:ABC transporter n=1 Tax=Mizugakiibacter sediminis TaxID=1475481 RepID=A0A0K8QNF1_9GAMM|nr:peptidase domain-containing ABC transporter [Mizugakiibacter sediminis]GAP66409.1 ABC-type bacteriocin/lantibiotic exporter withN-terminal double-glycine peptidase domain [Mizugakiibacter sediminis]